MAKTKRTKAQLTEENDRFRAGLGTQRPVEAEPASLRDIFREERYRAILDGITEGYYEVDLAGNFTFFNAAMSRMLGYALSKLVGMNYRVYMARMQGRFTRSSATCSRPASRKWDSIMSSSAKTGPASPSRYRFR